MASVIRGDDNFDSANTGPQVRAWSSQSRSMNTTYTNTTGGEIQVFIVYWNNAVFRLSSWTIGGVTTASFSTYAGDNETTITVPDGTTYSFNTSSSTLRSWMELR